MKGVKFNDIHSYEDLNLVLAPFQMPPAEPKTNFIDVPGADGSLDATESHGEVKFKDRTGSMTFSVLPQDDFEVKKTQVSNLLNGLQCKIKLDKDPEFFYFGRLSVKDYKANKMLRQITVDFRVHPYKYKNDVTIKTFDLTKNTQEVILSNNRRSIAPEIELVSAKHIEKGTSIQIDSGDSTAKVFDFRLFGKSTQDGTPTPDAPVDIVSVENPKALICGKNLLENNLPQAVNAGVTFTKNVDGSITIDGTATQESYYTFNFQNDIPIHEKELIASFEGGNGKVGFVVGYFKEDGTVVNSIAYCVDKEISFVFPKEAHKTRIYLVVGSGKTFNNETVFPMIRLADAHSGFEAVKTLQKTVFPHTLHGIPVSSGGNYTDSSGQQWIGDEIDLVRGVYVQRVQKLTLNGSENWIVTGGNNQLLASGLPSSQMYAPKGGNGFCSHYPFKYNFAGDTLFVTEGTIYLGSTSSATYNVDVNTWKEFLTANNITVLYVLATPIETPLEDATFNLNAPITTILNDEGAEIQLEYSINALVGFGGNTYAVSEGTHMILDIYLKQGENPLSLVGSGQITFKYQEGAL